MTQLRASLHPGRRLRLAAAAGVVALLGLNAPVAAVADTVPPPGTPATVSADVLPTWQINGVVWSQVLVNNTVYATGSFTKARPAGVAAGGTGEVDALNIFAYDITSGNRVTSFSHSLNQQGRAITASPDGTVVYVGGDFTTVDGAARNHVAAFNTSTNTLNTSFQPSADNNVKALTATATTVYLGGSFQHVSPSSATASTSPPYRLKLAAVSATTGAVSSWAPKVDNGSVLAMALAPDLSRLIVGGSFTTINSLYAFGMGSVSTSTGSVLSWAANQKIKDAGSTAAIMSLRTYNGKIFGSGYVYGGGNFEGTFAADPYTGNLVLVNDCHGDTYDVLPLGEVLYSVGHAHDCRPVGGFPDTNPRVRWQRALAQTIAATRTNTGPDAYGWNYSSLPASTILHWFPQLSIGSYTGQSQAAWSLAGNGTYVALGGEFPKINGTYQQGLARMAVKASAPNRRGPTYTTLPATAIPATTASSPSPGTAKVTFGTAWDYDNNLLTYELLRDGNTTAVASTQATSNFWTLPLGTLNDTTAPVGVAHTYQVRIKDPFGNVKYSPISNSVTT